MSIEIVKARASMKFHWFAEAAYPHLPADFRKSGVSSWVDTPARYCDPRKTGAMCEMFVRLLQMADREGFDGLAVNEHHQTPFAMTPSPNLLAAILASTTQRAAILIIGNSLALYNPPIRVAEELAWIDCLSGGRVIAGFVFGTPMDSVFAYGVPPTELRERFHEARELILRAWTEADPFPFNGKYTKLRYVNVWPRPIQKKLPVWVPGSGSVETWDLAIDNNYCYGHLSFSGLHSAKPMVDAYWDHVAKRGGDNNPHRMAFTQLICTAPTDAEAEAKYDEAVRYFFRNRSVNPAFETPPGYRTIKSLKSMAGHQKITSSILSPEIKAAAARGELSFWDYDKYGFIIAGSPERVRQRVEVLAKDLRIGHLIGCFHMGNLSEEVAAENTQLFATQVIPRLRPLWNEHPDHWMPQQEVTPAQSRLAMVS
jgi:alkanesulfonate monooxygenase SsuD/methylene tetrahydromethanopterin reductase-like flavin-dependent oxidoreductase (luciferase family)